ncbi:MAG: cytochrome c biogenesis protein CcsA [Burkholderiaceae bacterium]|jgi:ABC-type uncharacterized transport system permease subunit|nr:cytochrome c biogenesis protein CcsA [Burkholderiaceae bacterium]
MILASHPLLETALGIAAMLVYMLVAAFASRLPRRVIQTLLGLAWLLQALTLGCGLTQGQPHFGFGPALSLTVWLALLVYGVENFLYPGLVIRPILALLGAVAVLLALVFPGPPLYTLTSPWLPLHLALGIASYGLFAVAVVHAGLLGRAERQIRHACDLSVPMGMPLLTLERLTFRFVSAGFVLLSATLLAGLLFSETLSPNGWRWDHKTVFSILAWVTFAVLLAGRARFGWRGRSATHILYAGALLLLLAYAGSRFVLEVVLHRAV